MNILERQFLYNRKDLVPTKLDNISNSKIDNIDNIDEYIQSEEAIALSEKGIRRTPFASP